MNEQRAQPDSPGAVARCDLLRPAVQAGPADVAAAPAAGMSLAAVLTRHILHDGELVLLVLKPSLWFLPLNMARFAAVVLIGMFAAAVFDDRLPGHSRTYLEVGCIILAGRFMLAILQWVGRLYMLTNMRIVRLSGVLRLSIFDCPLRKVARTRLLRSTHHRLLGIGSIEIIPSEENIPVGLWQAVARPISIHDQIIAAVNRAKQGRGADNGP